MGRGFYNQGGRADGDVGAVDEAFRAVYDAAVWALVGSAAVTKGWVTGQRTGWIGAPFDLPCAGEQGHFDS